MVSKYTVMIENA